MFNDTPKERSGCCTYLIHEHLDTRIQASRNGFVKRALELLLLLHSAIQEICFVNVCYLYGNC